MMIRHRVSFANTKKRNSNKKTKHINDWNIKRKCKKKKRKYTNFILRKNSTKSICALQIAANGLVLISRPEYERQMNGLYTSGPRIIGLSYKLLLKLQMTAFLLFLRFYLFSTPHSHIKQKKDIFFSHKKKKKTAGHV